MLKNLAQCLGLGMSFILFSNCSYAEEQRLKVVGDTIFFDGYIPYDEEEADIGNEDLETLKALLENNSGIKILRITSGGGAPDPAYAMARLISDYGLETTAYADCISACIPIFLAGNPRTLALGARLGFHGSYWPSDNMKNFYIRNKAARGWDDPIEFATWAYEDGRQSSARIFEYMFDKGVSPEFTIKISKLGRDDYWYPTRNELVNANILKTAK